MPDTEEQRLDIIHYCSVLLNKLESFEQTDDTPEGRMITQCKWLKERAENYALRLPVNRGYLATLGYIYTNGNLGLLASKPNDEQCEYLEIGLPMKRLLYLTEDGELLLKPEYKPYVSRCMDALLGLLKRPTRTLSQYEYRFISEVDRLRDVLQSSDVLIPLINYRAYPNMIKVGANLDNRPLDGLPNGTELFRMVDDMMFGGIRPDSWLTTDDADRHSAALLAGTKLP